MSCVQPPARIPLLMRLVLSLVAHDKPEVLRRLLGLIRLHTSFLVFCPFCIDMNAGELLEKGSTAREIGGLQGVIPLEEVPSFDERERAALRCVQCMCSTPLSFPARLLDSLQSIFSPRAIVIIAGTCAQVNFWARLIQALGVPPAGFSAQWPVLSLEAFTTRR